MKYIVNFREDARISANLPLPALLEQVEATRPYLEDLRKREKVIDFGYSATQHGFYAVFNVRSHAELFEAIDLCPVRPFCTIESEPVLEAGEWSESFGRIKREALSRWERTEAKFGTSTSKHDKSKY